MLVEGSAGLAYAAWQEDASNNKNKISAVVLCGANSVSYTHLTLPTKA